MWDCLFTFLKTAKKGTVIVGKMLLLTGRFFFKRFAEQIFSISFIIFLREVRNDACCPILFHFKIKYCLNRNDVNVPFTSLNRKTKKVFPSKP